MNHSLHFWEESPILINNWKPGWLRKALLLQAEHALCMCCCPGEVLSCTAAAMPPPAHPCPNVHGQSHAHSFYQHSCLGEGQHLCTVPTCRRVLLIRKKLHLPLKRLGEIMLGSGNTDKRIFIINLAISYVPKSLYNTGNLQNSLKIKVSISVLHVHFADGLTPAVRCYKIFWINGWSGWQDGGGFYLTPNPWHDCYVPAILTLPIEKSAITELAKAPFPIPKS